MKTTRNRLHSNLLCLLLLVVPNLGRTADTLVEFFDFWLYIDNGANQGTAWQTPAFDDSNWNVGLSQFGFGEGDEFTELNSAPGGVPLNTAYFRTIFNVANAGSYSNLTLRMLRDDGAIVYLNGVEVFRSNMDTGVVNYATKALRNIESNDESLLAQRVVPAGVLVNGRNVLAVEVHQAEGGNDDMSFALILLGHRVGENQPPSANDSFVSMEQDKSTNITLNAVDPENTPLTYTLLSSPRHGTLTGVAPTFIYTPDAGYAGPDLFSFKASDGEWETEIADVNIEVKAASNHPPVADSQNVTVLEDMPLTITLSANDPDGDELAYFYSSPSHGILAPGPNHTVVYQPAVNYNGPDAFAFWVEDGHGATSSATVSITVIPVNDAPAADTQSLSTDEDTSLTITLTANDVDGDTLSFAYVQPAHGVVTGSGKYLTYAPEPNFNGNDSFLFTVTDGNGGTTTSIIRITVLPVNDAPTAAGQKVTTLEDTPVEISLIANDVDGDVLAYSYTTPEHGVLKGTGNRIVYEPAPDFNGNDSFIFMVSDGNGGLATATVTLTIEPVNDAPKAQPQNITVPEDTAVSIALQASDIDGDTLQFSCTQPLHGTVSGTSRTAVYVPAPNYNGPDSFTFTADDGHGGIATATVNITVTSVNDVPKAVAWAAPASDPTRLARNLTLMAANNQNALVFLKGSASSDPDSDSLSYVWYQGESATPFSTDRDLTVTLPIGSYTITLVVSDGLASASDTIAVQVFTACNLVQTLIGKVNAVILKASERNMLLAHLNTACSSFDAQDISGGVHQLELFKSRVSAKVSDPATAQMLIGEAQNIIDQVSAH